MRQIPGSADAGAAFSSATLFFGGGAFLYVGL